MRLMIESTDAITTANGVQVRHWRGWTESGAYVDVFVLRIGTADVGAQSELAASLTEVPRPRELADIEVDAARRLPIDIRHIL